MLNENLNQEPLYPIVHLKNGDIEITFTHGTQYSEEYYSFVNGQNTTQVVLTWLAFREAFVKTILTFIKKILMLMILDKV